MARFKSLMGFTPSLTVGKRKVGGGLGIMPLGRRSAFAKVMKKSRRKSLKALFGV